MFGISKPENGAFGGRLLIALISTIQAPNGLKEDVESWVMIKGYQL